MTCVIVIITQRLGGGGDGRGGGETTEMLGWISLMVAHKISNP